MKNCVIVTGFEYDYYITDADNKAYQTVTIRTGEAIYSNALDYQKLVDGIINPTVLSEVLLLTAAQDSILTIVHEVDMCLNLVHMKIRTSGYELCFYVQLSSFLAAAYGSPITEIEIEKRNVVITTPPLNNKDTISHNCRHYHGDRIFDKVIIEISDDTLYLQADDGTITHHTVNSIIVDNERK